MTRHRLRALLLFVCVPMFASAPATAAPLSLDRVPIEGPLATVAVTNLNELDAQIEIYEKIVGGAPLPRATAILSAMGFGELIDRGGSLACLLFEPADPPEPGDAPPGSPRTDMVFIVTLVDETAAWTELKAEAEGELRRFDYAGERYYAKPLGDRIVAVSSVRERVASYDGSAGKLAAHREALGAQGSIVLDRATIVVRTDRASADRALALLLGAAEAGGVPLPQAPAGPGTDPAAWIPSRLSRIAADESRGIVLGFQLQQSGLRADLAAGFAKDSLMHRACQAGPPSASGLGLLPARTLMVALSLDAGHPGMRILADELSPPGRSIGIGAGAERTLMDSLRTLDVWAIALPAPPNLILGFAREMVIAWRGPEAGEPARLFKEWLTSIHGEATRGGDIAATYADAALRPGGAKTSAWSLTPPAGSIPMLPLLLGPVPGFKGFVAEKGEVGTLTWIEDKALLESAVAAATNGEATVAALPAVQRSLAMVPGPRMAEAVFDIGPLVRLAAPMIDPNFAKSIPADLPPIVAGVVVSEGSGRLSIVAPADVLRVVNELQRRTGQQERSREQARQDASPAAKPARRGG